MEIKAEPGRRVKSDKISFSGNKSSIPVTLPE